MDRDEQTLKITSLLRNAGVADIPRPVLIGTIAIGLVLILWGAWHFLPKPSTDFVATAQAETQESSASSTAASASAATTIIVDVEGAVNAPGLYSLPVDARIGDAVTAAGGLATDAVAESINLAQKLSDGEQVIVASNTADAESGGATAATQSGKSANGKININTASAEQLQELSGVGPSLSERIVQYREQNGHFKKIEDIQNVSGIGETRFNNLKDLICV